MDAKNKIEVNHVSKVYKMYNSPTDKLLSYEAYMEQRNILIFWH